MPTSSPGRRPLNRLRPAIALAATVALTIATAAAAAVPIPIEDPFFSIPKRAQLKNLDNGTILDSRRIAASAVGVPMPAASWQVKYKSIDVHRRPTATVTTVMVPTTPWSGEGERPMVSYQTAEDGVGSQCAPSYALSSGFTLHPSNSHAETAAMLAALALGYAVSAPDYQGLYSEFLGAKGEGRMTLDGIRAAVAFEPAGFSERTEVGIWGYSGGAFATSIAAQMQPAYAPELNLVGVALGGVVAELRSTIYAFSGSVLGGAIPMGFNGVDRSYPQQRITRYLNDAGLAAMKATETDCINDAAIRYPGAEISDFAKDPDVLERPRLKAFLRRISPLGVRGTPSAPVYGYHAVHDQFAPIEPARKLYERYCRRGATVQLQEELVGEHISLVAVGALGALSYLGDRFAGKPAPSTC